MKLKMYESEVKAAVPNDTMKVHFTSLLSELLTHKLTVSF